MIYYFKNSFWDKIGEVKKKSNFPKHARNLIWILETFVFTCRLLQSKIVGFTCGL